jgi:hypothetical protein
MFYSTVFRFIGESSSWKSNFRFVKVAGVFWLSSEKFWGIKTVSDILKPKLCELYSAKSSSGGGSSSEDEKKEE